MTLPLSFEFFPPKTPEGVAKLRLARQELYRLKPEFCSVTYGAGGSTSEGTFGAVKEILAEGMDAASHFSCIGATRTGVREQLAMLREMGVKRLVALRGDLPSGYGTGGEFHYASDLVAFIRAETGDAFRIEVACYPEVHPQARSPEADLQAFATKMRAGANSAITQYFYNADSYFRFVDDVRKLGLDVPVVRGGDADRQLHPVDAVLRCLRRGNPALDAAAAAKLRRRQRLDQGFRPGRGDPVVRAAARRRRARPALLHHEPERGLGRDLPAPAGLGNL